jgi:SWI/SNF-related matrix-associated actin-dependent regulator 1 of chromatin subfamily A
MFESEKYEKDVPKSAGFFYDRKLTKWWTRDFRKAIKLMQYADERTKIHLESMQENLRISSATDSNIDIPSPEGLDYFPFQKVGIEFGLNQDNIINADDMGLGKTIQAIGTINGDSTLNKVLVVCEATAVINWHRELTKWLVRDLSVSIAPYSGEFQDTDVVVINYTSLKKHEEAIKDVAWDFLVVDEAQNIINPKSQRSKIIMGFEGKDPFNPEKSPIKARKKQLLTGTPAVNRPSELFTLLSYLDPYVWNSKSLFTNRYCKVDGPMYKQRLDELHAKLRGTLMVRRKKPDVFKDMPEKVRAVYALPANKQVTALANKEHDTLSDFDEALFNATINLQLKKCGGDLSQYREAMDGLSAVMGDYNKSVSEIRQSLAIQKVPLIVNYVHETLENSDDDYKIIIYTYHRKTCDAFIKAFGKEAVHINGSTSTKKRQAAIDAFQEDPTKRVFIGTLGSCATSINLTKAQRVIFAEADWVPNKLLQAEDRAHRYGQLNSVLCQYFVFSNTVEEHVADTFVSKQSVLDIVMDGIGEQENQLSLVNAFKKTKSYSQKITRGRAEQVLEKISDRDTFLEKVSSDLQTYDISGFMEVDRGVVEALRKRNKITMLEAVFVSGIFHEYNKEK